MDLLLVLIFEGRRALVRPNTVSKSCQALKKNDNAAGHDKTQRQLIEFIRGKDTEALIEAIENGEIK